MDARHVAWAAGLFDAEGSVYTWPQRAGLRREMAVSQGGDGAVPDVLLRFRDAVGGHGRIRGPVRGYLYYWYAGRQDVIDSVSASLWPWLAREKRAQFERAAVAMGRDTPRDVARQRCSRFEPAELAWAAGFFEGEGTVALNGSAPRLWLPQASAQGIPEVLARFQAAVGGLGSISGPYVLKNPWSKLPQYRWGLSRFEHVQAVIAMFWPWMSARRRSGARAVLLRQRATGGPP